MYSGPSEQRGKTQGETLPNAEAVHLLVQGNAPLPNAISSLNNSVLSEVVKYQRSNAISHLITVARFCSFNKVA